MPPPDSTQPAAVVSDPQGASPGRFDAWLAEARGGLVSAAVAAPLAVGYGMFAFVGLGDEFFGHGVLAGLVGAIAAGLVCVLLGDRTGAIYAPGS